MADSVEPDSTDIPDQPSKKQPAKKPKTRTEDALDTVFKEGGVASRILDTVSSILGKPQRADSNRARKKQAKAEAITSKKTIKKAAKKAADALTLGPEIEVFPLNPEESLVAAGSKQAELVASAVAAAPAESIVGVVPVAAESPGIELLPAAEISDEALVAAGPSLTETKEKVFGAKAAAQSTKFELQIKPMSEAGPAKRPPEARELPDHYEATRLVMLVRDPQWVFAYWEVSKKDREKLESKGVEPEGPVVLRLFDLGEPGRGADSADHSFDLPIDVHRGSSYIRLLQPNRIWRAELGQVTEEGFVPICRSNTIRTPRDSVAEWGEESVQPHRAEDGSFMEIFQMSGGESVGTNEPLGTESIARRVQHAPLRVRTLAASDLSSPQGALLPPI